MDDTIPRISFDNNGVCNYCAIHDRMDSCYPLDGEREHRLLTLIEQIKADGKGRSYDCIVGVSGGCDSSYLMHLLKQYGLRIVAVTFDNTWSTSISVENIFKIISQLGIDLYTYVVDGPEFNDICRSFLYASVADADVPNDIAIAKLYYMAMDKYDVNYSICGHSFRTEGTVPIGWTYMDGKYIESVHQQFGSMPMRTFPNLGIDYWMGHLDKKRIRLLYYIDYDKERAKRELQEKFGWQWYGGHHFENEYTRFVKSYLLPRKFKIDKRYVEFSALVRSNQMNRDEAISILQSPPPEEPGFVDYVISRLGLSRQQFDAIMHLPIKSFRDYETYHQYFIDNREMFKDMLNRGLIPQTFYEKYTSE